MRARRDHKLGRWGVLALLIALIAAFGVVGCGGSDDETANDGGGETAATTEQGNEASESSEPETLKVALSTASQGAFNYVAIDQGYFEDENLDVEILTEVGANASNLAVSGQVDVSTYGLPLAVAGQGKEVRIIQGTVGAGISGMIAGNPDKISTLEELQALEDCKVATFAEGTFTWIFAKKMIESLDLDCTRVPFQDSASVIGALVSGRADAALGALTIFASTIDEGKAVWIVNTLEDQELAKELFGEPVPEASYWGIPERLEEKREPIVRWFRAMNRAREFAKDPANTEAFIDTLEKLEPYQGMSREEIEENVVVPYRFYPFEWGDGTGFISEDVWNNVLEAGKGEIPGFEFGDPAFDYKNMIDMSYLEEALSSSE